MRQSCLFECGCQSENSDSERVRAPQRRIAEMTESLDQRGVWTQQGNIARSSRVVSFTTGEEMTLVVGESDDPNRQRTDGCRVPSRRGTVRVEGNKLRYVRGERAHTF